MLNRRTLILTGLAVAAVSGCSVDPKAEILTGAAAYVAQNPDNPLAKVAATASQQIGWRLLVQSDRTKTSCFPPPHCVPPWPWSASGPREPPQRAWTSCSG